MTERQSPSGRAARVLEGGSHGRHLQEDRGGRDVPESFADATRVAIAEVTKSVKHTSWFEVAEMRGAIKGNQVSEFQVTVRIGFKVEHSIRLHPPLPATEQ